MDTATITAAPANANAANGVDKIDRFQLEDAYADLEVAGALLDCCESLGSDIRTLFEAAGQNVNTYREFMNLDILLAEVLQKTRDARSKIDTVVDQVVAVQSDPGPETAE